MRPHRPRIALALALAALTFAGPAAAQPLTAGSADPGCGGDAFSSAQVIEHRPPRHGPLVSVPDTLCADLAPQPGSPATQIEVYPLIMPQVGSGPGDIPYGGGSTRPYRP
ncbi:hypothetical protein [Methylobacterium brachiatum]|uniref:hypothetical protein n=1 Tax=Methylobacterium brachiatum TaxID=269660 RepID=UPI0008F2A099|nr:hypothetical protein [Methylobacterium brachiatum]CAA2157598.1 hypothetical protein MBRA_02972 [Methylobacterium brachiatum]SFI04086.1 hypothetical protein SAMN02799642_00484 [Methylobacterium brachiatum]